jgi:hypothetical protein
VVLDKLGLDYYITGGMAVSVWGRPRATFDIDVVINLVEPQIKKLSAALLKISKQGYMDEEVAQEALRTHGEFNFINPESGVKIDFWIAKMDELTKQEFIRRKSVKIARQKVYFISPEDLIISKLIWHKKTDSSRHLEDAQSVFKILGKKLDLKYLKNWADKLGATEELGVILK